MLVEIKHRKDIQILRGLAVLAVVLFHANESYFPLGYLGVDVFFVISGFVITPLILSIFTEQAKRGGKLSSLRHFYKRRFYRLAPALAVTLAISAILIFFVGSTIDHDRFSKQGIATLILAGNLGAYKYSGDYFIPYPNPLIHTWSLSVEEQIYMFMPVILLIFIYNRKHVHKIALKVLVVITLLSFFSFLFPTILMPIYSRIGLNIQLTSLISFYSPIDRIWQFTLGGLGYLFMSKNKNTLYKFQNQSINQSINLVIVLGLFVILYAPITINLKLSSFLASLITIAAIIFRSFNVFPNMLSAKFEWLGDRSYSIYLFHMPLLYIAKYSPIMQIGSGENSVIQSTIAVVISIVLVPAIASARVVCNAIVEEDAARTK
jgi:peptidoglycan/LPS O-acetylase OafA/YrhL